jgi:flavin reductase (DIM6/NTAB) family NADH-FMN oxidoreductase RutF
MKHEFPSVKHYPECFETIHCNGPDNDEIADAGLTVEPARVVQAPRIAECAINLECKLAWHRSLYEDSQWHLFVGRVLHVAMDETAMVVDPEQRMQALGLMYNVRGTVNPLNGAYYGPNTLGLLDRVMRIYSPEQEEDRA